MKKQKIKNKTKGDKKFWSWAWALRPRPLPYFPEKIAGYLSKFALKSHLSYTWNWISEHPDNFLLNRGFVGVSTEREKPGPWASLEFGDSDRSAAGEFSWLVVVLFLLLLLVVVMGKVAVGAAVVCAATVCAAAALIVRHRMRSSGRWARAMAILREFEEKCEAPLSKLKQMADAMTVEMHAGLASEGGSKLKMIISYVDNLPTG